MKLEKLQIVSHSELIGMTPSMIRAAADRIKPLDPWGILRSANLSKENIRNYGTERKNRCKLVIF